MVSVVLPAKNEADSLANLLPELVELAEQNAWEILVINDGSTDNTSDICRQFPVREIVHLYSKGNGAAIKSGTREALGDTIVFMDADGQHNPADIKRLLVKIDEGYELVVGARQKGSQASIPRAVANGFYNFLASNMTGQKVEDLSSGFRAVKSTAFRKYLYLLPNGFSYPTTSTMAFFRSGLAVCYVPIHAAKREGKSHIKPMKDGARFLLIIFKIAVLYSPLKLFAPVSLGFMACGVAWYGYTFMTMSRFTNMSALLITAGFFVMAMGLISEQITTLMYRDSDD